VYIILPHEMSDNGNEGGPRENDPLLPRHRGSIDDKTVRTAETSTDSGSDDESSNNNLVGAVIETIQDAVENAGETLSDAVEVAQEKTQELVDAVQEATTEMVEELVEEATDLQDIVHDKLHEAECSDMGLMDMALTRHLSILPADFTQVAAVVQDPSYDLGDVNLEATEHMENAALPLLDNQHEGDQQLQNPALGAAAATVPLSAYLMLAIAVVGLASVGPILDLQQGCSPLMKTVWRQNGTILLMLPLVPLDWKKNGFPKLTCAQWTNFMAASAAYSAGNVCFVTALEYTAVGNAGKKTTV